MVVKKLTGETLLESRKHVAHERLSP